MPGFCSENLAEGRVGLQQRHPFQEKKNYGSVSPLYISQDKYYYLLINDIWNVPELLWAAYSMQAESLESDEVWQFFFYFFPIKQNQVSLSSSDVQITDHHTNVFICHKVAYHFIKGVWAFVNMRPSSLWWFDKIVLICVNIRNIYLQI